MDATALLTFLGPSIVVIATPGPDTALTVRNTLLGGRSAGTFTAWGVSMGQVTWSVATSLGLVAVLLASKPIFQTLKLVGAAYLVYLGIRSLLAACQRLPLSDGVVARGAGTSLARFTALRQGIINNLANPKMAVFFASVLPQCAPPGDGMLSRLLLLGVLFSVLAFLWLTAYAVAIARAGRLLRGSRVASVVEGVAGLTLIGLGVRVAIEERWIVYHPAARTAGG
jgi:threonine/homoserine/homoserine lactone efflux protein